MCVRTSLLHGLLLAFASDLPACVRFDAVSGHLGMFNWSYVPTSRGFDKYYGYHTAADILLRCTIVLSDRRLVACACLNIHCRYYTGAEDYWTHYSGVGYDIHDGTQIDWSPSCSLPDQQECPNSQYSTHLFTTTAEQYLVAHAETQPHAPLFLYPLASNTAHTVTDVSLEVFAQSVAAKPHT